jgi:opacity protein-like surface antigen
MRNPLNHWKSNLAMTLGLLVAAPAVVSAQAIVTAQRGAEIAPFVQTTILNPDYGHPENVGYTVGVDYTRFLRSIVQPSLEVRYVSANGATVDEHSITGGLKLGVTVHGIHPYATLLAGTGGITFVHPSPGYPSDTAAIYSIGAGADFNVLPNWKLRADFLHQNWNLDPNSLTPMVLSVGVSYSIPFRGGGWVH